MEKGMRCKKPGNSYKIRDSGLFLCRVFHNSILQNVMENGGSPDGREASARNGVQRNGRL